MTLYLAVRTYESFDHGEFQSVLGVFTSAALAARCLANQGDFNNVDQRSEWCWMKHAGQDNKYFEVRECLLDKEIE